MDVPRLFLDANVIFSAAITPDGVSRSLFELASIGDCELITSGFALDEARRNARLRYPEYSPEIESLLDNLRLIPEAPGRRVRSAEQHVTLKDAPILAAAVDSGAQILVTGDGRHFGHLYGTTVDGLVILPLREALAFVRSFGDI